MKDKELKPCPFCGGEAALIMKDNCYYVVCASVERCSVEVQTIPKLQKKSAIKIWNKRHGEQ